MPQFIRVFQIALIQALFLVFGRPGNALESDATFCNPINIDYRFALGGPSRREAADPVVVLFQGEYYLFASKSGGYWHSSDLSRWKFVEPQGLPIENYAPAVLVVGDALLYTAGASALYRTDDPKGGKWQQIADLGKYGDPALFQDQDGRIYLYYGLAKNGAISVVELDAQTFAPKGQAVESLRGDATTRGWERSGEANLGPSHFIEGAWMTRHKDTYYLQYAAPGTIWNTYADGVFTAPSPLGPFTYAPNSPVSQHPTGFVGGAGHGCTFQDKNGHYWRAVTAVISVKERFERRISIFPAAFDRDGVMHTNTVFGDYPQLLPGKNGGKNAASDNSAGWMLLYAHQNAAASSAMPGHGVGLAFDEDIRTHWSAKSGNRGEWLGVDLGKRCAIFALQINFAEQDTNAVGREERLFHQYQVEVSNDGRNWSKIVDKSANLTDVPHDYVQLEAPRFARYLRITNLHMPGNGKFAIRDLRVFGNGLGRAPAPVRNVGVWRDPSDGREAVIGWKPAARAEGYIVRYGIAPDKLYNSYQVRGATQLSLHSLNAGVTYYFAVDAFNSSGRTSENAARSAQMFSTLPALQAAFSPALSQR